MKKLATIMAVLTVIATPAFAQYDPSGNIGQITHPADAYHSQYAAAARDRNAAHVYAQPFPGHRMPVRPFTRNEELRFDQAKGQVDKSDLTRN